MSNLNQSKTGLYRDASTDIHYGVVKRGGKQIKQSLETDRADIAGEKLKQFLANVGGITTSVSNTTWKQARGVWEGQWVDGSPLLAIPNYARNNRTTFPSDEEATS